MNFLHLIVNTNSTTLAPSMIEGALSQYEHTSVMTGYWIVKSDRAVEDIVGQIRPVFGSIPFVLFRTDESAFLNGAIFPENVRGFLGSKQSAA